jgi:diguanylate cyclase
MAETIEQNARFSRRVYPARVLVYLLALPAIGSVFHETGAPWHFWSFLLFLGICWPHLAYRLALRTDNHTDAEYRVLMTDATYAGILAPLASFNLLTCMILLASVGLVSASLGGRRLLLRALFVSVAAAVAGWAWAGFIWPGFAFRPESTLSEIVAAAPVLIGTPVAVAMMTFRLSRRLAQQREELEELSRQDGLSRLYNRRYWEECVYLEFDRHQRYGYSMSLLMIDIDHFKTINDRYGHQAGDHMISELADLLKGSIRKSDISGRYGGEEFGILLPATDLNGALVLAERLREVASELTVKPFDIKCTISVGVTQMEYGLESYEELIRQADAALYQAKRAGRNRCLAYSQVASAQIPAEGDVNTNGGAALVVDRQGAAQI